MPSLLGGGWDLFKFRYKGFYNRCQVLSSGLNAGKAYERGWESVRGLVGKTSCPPCKAGE